MKELHMTLEINHININYCPIISEKIKIKVLVIRPAPCADYISMAVTGLHYSLDDDFIIGYKVESAGTVYIVSCNV